MFLLRMCVVLSFGCLIINDALANLGALEVLEVLRRDSENLGFNSDTYEEQQRIGTAAVTLIVTSRLPLPFERSKTIREKLRNKPTAVTNVGDYNRWAYSSLYETMMYGKTTYDPQGERHQSFGLASRKATQLEMTSYVECFMRADLVKVDVEDILDKATSVAELQDRRGQEHLKSCRALWALITIERQKRAYPTTSYPMPFPATVSPSYVSYFNNLDPTITHWATFNSFYKRLVTDEPWANFYLTYKKSAGEERLKKAQELKKQEKLRELETQRVLNESEAFSRSILESIKLKQLRDEEERKRQLKEQEEADRKRRERQAEVDAHEQSLAQLKIASQKEEEELRRLQEQTRQERVKQEEKLRQERLKQDVLRVVVRNWGRFPLTIVHMFYEYLPPATRDPLIDCLASDTHFTPPLRMRTGSVIGGAIPLEFTSGVFVQPMRAERILAVEEIDEKKDKESRAMATAITLSGLGIGAPLGERLFLLRDQEAAGCGHWLGARENFTRDPSTSGSVSIKLNNGTTAHIQRPDGEPNNIILIRGTQVKSFPVDPESQISFSEDNDQKYIIAYSFKKPSTGVILGKSGLSIIDTQSLTLKSSRGELFDQVHAPNLMNWTSWIRVWMMGDHIIMHSGGSSSSLSRFDAASKQLMVRKTNEQLRILTFNTHYGCLFGLYQKTTDGGCVVKEIDWETLVPVEPPLRSQSSTIPVPEDVFNGVDWQHTFLKSFGQQLVLFVSDPSDESRSTFTAYKWLLEPITMSSKV